MNIITQSEELIEACQKLSESTYITVDTEFVRENTFWPELCLIQMANDHFECLVDPLSNGIDLEPFFALMTDAQITKVFHSARQDIEIVFKMSGKRMPNPVFDTQIAAMVCGFGESISYANLVESITRNVLDKGARYTDWRKRPLTDKQKHYALNDVTYLRDVYKSLKEQLEQTGRTSWLDEEMAVLINPATYEQIPEDAWKRLRMREKKPESIAVLIAMAKWREEKAQRQNVPRGRVIKDDAIYDIASQLPTNDKELARLRSMGKNTAGSQRAKDIIYVVTQALASDFTELPKISYGKKPSPSVLATAELLKVLLKAVSSAQGVAPKIIASAADVEKIAADEAANVPAMQGWRYEIFGKQAVLLKNGNLALTLKNGSITFLTL